MTRDSPYDLIIFDTAPTGHTPASVDAAQAMQPTDVC